MAIMRRNQRQPSLTELLVAAASSLEHQRSLDIVNEIMRYEEKLLLAKKSDDDAAAALLQQDALLVTLEKDQGDATAAQCLDDNSSRRQQLLSSSSNISNTSSTGSSSIFSLLGSSKNTALSTVEEQSQQQLASTKENSTTQLSNPTISHSKDEEESSRKQHQEQQQKQLIIPSSNNSISTSSMMKNDASSTLASASSSSKFSLLATSKNRLQSASKLRFFKKKEEKQQSSMSIIGGSTMEMDGNDDDGNAMIQDTPIRGDDDDATSSAVVAPGKRLGEGANNAMPNDESGLCTLDSNKDGSSKNNTTRSANIIATMEGRDENVFLPPIRNDGDVSGEIESSTSSSSTNTSVRSSRPNNVRSRGGGAAEKKHWSRLGTTPIRGRPVVATSLAKSSGIMLPKSLGGGPTVVEKSSSAESSATTAVTEERKVESMSRRGDTKHWSSSLGTPNRSLPTLGSAKNSGKLFKSQGVPTERGSSKGSIAATATVAEEIKVESSQPADPIIDFEESEEIELSYNDSVVSSPTSVAGVLGRKKLGSDDDGENASRDYHPSKHIMRVESKESEIELSFDSASSPTSVATNMLGLRGDGKNNANDNDPPSMKMTRDESTNSMAKVLFDEPSPPRLPTSHEASKRNDAGFFQSVATKQWSSVADSKECSTLSGFDESYDESINVEDFENYVVAHAVSQRRLQPLAERDDGNVEDGSICHEEEDSFNNKISSSDGKDGSVNSSASTKSDDDIVRKKNGIRRKLIRIQPKKGRQRQSIGGGIPRRTSSKKLTAEMSKKNDVEEPANAQKVNGAEVAGDVDENAAAAADAVKTIADGKDSIKENDDDSKYWKAARDTITFKLYYYNTKTNKTSWKKPPQFDDSKLKGIYETVMINDIGNDCEDEHGVDVEYFGPASVSRRRHGVAEKASPAAAETTSEDKVAIKENSSNSKYRKAALDNNTFKQYYYNSKTKEVSWAKPPGFNDSKIDESLLNTGNHLEGGDDTGIVYSGPTSVSKHGQQKVEEVSISIASGVFEESAHSVSPENGKGDDVDSASALKPQTNSHGRTFGIRRVIPKKPKKAHHTQYTESNKKAARGGNYNGSKYWKVTFDPNTHKPYYYNGKTKEVTWVKPLGFDNSGMKSPEKDTGVTSKETEEVTGSLVAGKKEQHIMRFNPPKETTYDTNRIEGLGDENIEVEDENLRTKIQVIGERNSIAETKTVDAAEEINDSANDNSAKYWKATLDAATGKTYYHNKKTKTVTWTKPSVC